MLNNLLSNLTQKKILRRAEPSIISSCFVLMFFASYDVFCVPKRWQSVATTRLALEDS